MASKDKNKGPGESLKNVWISLCNVAARLFLNHPLFVFVFLFFAWLALYYFSQSEAKMTFGLCILITLVSFINYTRSKNYGETLLAFMLGVLTVFTIQWSTYSSVLFVSFYIAFNAFIFIFSSVSIASKVETELTVAASFIDLRSHKTIYSKLKEISDIGTRFNSLGPLNRAIALKFMAFMKISMDEMTDGLKNIEYIKVIYNVEIDKACEIFRVLYFITQRTRSSITVTDFLDEIVYRRIPITPNEFFNIVGRTKGVFIRDDMSIHDYLSKMEQLVMDGYEEEEIISHFNRTL